MLTRVCSLIICGDLSSIKGVGTTLCMINNNDFPSVKKRYEKIGLRERSVHEKTEQN